MGQKTKTRFKIPLFWSTVISVLLVYILLKWGLAYFSMLVTGSERPLPVPGALMVMFMGLTFIGAFVYVCMNDETLAEFTAPIITFLKGKEKAAAKEAKLQHAVRICVLVAFPLLAGGFVYSKAAPGVKTPTVLRIQHPAIPGAYEKLENPFRNADPETMARYIEEGRILYQINCRPCHGTKADGKGPMAKGYRLKPADFTDPGTIATLVEAYAFWRIKEGAAGIPFEASPWDSAMPDWKDELTDEQIWKIVLAEYEIAAVEPRKPE
ncbi:MAG: cytochrome c [Desulfatiglandales bacterium]